MKVLRVSSERWKTLPWTPGEKEKKQHGGRHAARTHQSKQEVKEESKYRRYLSHAKGNISNIEASGLSCHLTANYGHLCRRCSHSSRGGRRQQSYCWYLPGRWGRESQKRQNCHLLQPPLYYFIRGNCCDSFLDDSSNVRTNVSRESTFILRELLKRILSEIWRKFPVS